MKQTIETQLGWVSYNSMYENLGADGFSHDGCKTKADIANRKEMLNQIRRGFDGPQARGNMVLTGYRTWKL